MAAPHGRACDPSPPRALLLSLFFFFCPISFFPITSLFAAAAFAVMAPAPVALRMSKFCEIALRRRPLAICATKQIAAYTTTPSCTPNAAMPSSANHLPAPLLCCRGPQSRTLRPNRKNTSSTWEPLG
ncbi:uncharacterized protein SETTUDRAFT_37080 [Exserohilum turcica Et28A]|uniref:Uncharacterized protein n=1 Tax=Exserohilum turcicum (strain 28A) TaxID=671987 RepID=R0KBX4_EXST2|nr:uncharacterized protein SETTUDRAFT_37080 [Exserohilum turcica Et28A]EOA90443.1 hypothetical protein SETTUDRAFT_37080 [Exserohilum turcica Et28A]